MLADLIPANAVLSAEHLQTSCRPSGGDRQHVIAGKPDAIGSNSFKIAGPIRGIRHSTVLGQLHAIDITSSERDWANSMLSEANLQASCRPSGGLRRCLITGQPGVVGSISFKTVGQFGAFVAGPTPCYRHYLLREGLGQRGAIGVTPFRPPVGHLDVIDSI